MRPTSLQQPQTQSHYANVTTSPTHSRPISRAGSASSSRSIPRESKSRRSTPNHKSSTAAAAMLPSSSPSVSPSPSLKPMKQDAKSSRQPEVVGCSTPGLISLSRPVTAGAQVSSGKSSRKAVSKAARHASGDSRAAPSSVDGNADKAQASNSSTVSDDMLLSTSAPSARPRDKASVSDGLLTWQQQLMSGSSTTKGKGSSKKGPRAKTADAAALSDKTKNDPTWQQALFNSNSKGKKGPKFDVFADSRDAETFGPADSSGLRRSGSLGDEVNRANIVKKVVAARSSACRGSGPAPSNGKANRGDSNMSKSEAAGDISVDDVFNNHRSSSSSGLSSSSKSGGQRNSLPPQPSTPARRPQGHPSSSPALIPSTSAHHLLPPSAAESAYAGPDFHNSPSAASLPAPKFMSSRASKAIQASGSAGRLSSASLSSSISSEGSDHGQAIDVSANSSFRSFRAGPAPPTAHDSSSPSKATESSLSRIGELTTTSSTPAARAATDKTTTIETLLARMMG